MATEDIPVSWEHDYTIWAVTGGLFLLFTYWTYKRKFMGYSPIIVNIYVGIWALLLGLLSTLIPMNNTNARPTVAGVGFSWLFLIVIFLTPWFLQAIADIPPNDASFDVFLSNMRMVVTEPMRHKTLIVCIVIIGAASVASDPATWYKKSTAVVS